MLPLPETYINSICEIKTLENDLVATGVIAEITPDYVQIKDKTGSMAVVSYSTIVKINVFNFRLGFRVLVGKVYLSTMDFIRLIEITSLLDYERRNFFRVETNIRATIERPRKKDEQTAEQGEQGEEQETITITVRVRDLSLGGVLFFSDENFSIGDEFAIKLHIGHLNTTLPCVLRRVKQVDQTYRYGCEFVGLTEAQNGALCAFVFQRQREQINKTRQ